MKSFRIALAGLGTVGGGVANLLSRNASLIEKRIGRRLEIVAVCARDESRTRPAGWPEAAWCDEATDLPDVSELDCVVELMGGAEGAARALVTKALTSGVPVVTANKALLATHGLALTRLAAAKAVPLAFEASVCGGMPVMKTLRESLAGNEILSLSGILNGTCNFILTRMAKDGLSFEDALKLAQEKGFAEADPSSDIDGFDARHKLTLLIALAFGVAPCGETIPTQGLRALDPCDFAFAAAQGLRLKMLGVARQRAGGLERWVAPCLVPQDATLASVEDEVNALQIEGDAVGPLTIIGRGAGAQATASAVVGDLIDLARGAKPLPWGMPVELLQIEPPPVAETSARWYVRGLGAEEALAAKGIPCVARQTPPLPESALRAVLAALPQALALRIMDAP